MSESFEQEQQVQLTIEQAESFVKRRDALTALTSSPHWKTLINEVYFEKEPIRLVLLKSDPGMQTPEKQAAIDKDILAIGAFRQFLSASTFLGNNAEASLAGHHAALEEIRAEEAGLEADDVEVDELG